MENQILLECTLFHQMSEEDISSVLYALRAQERQYKKGSVILSAGHTTESMGLVLSGSVTVQSNDLWGNRTILSHVCRGDYFGGVFAWLRDEVMPVDVVANENCRILFLSIGQLPDLPPEQHPWAARLTANLLTIAARKNLMLTGRVFHTTPKSARARIMAYLNSVSLQKQSREFDIPFDRQQLADYLNLDRSAMSKELGRMRSEGLIQARKKHFVLL